MLAGWGGRLLDLHVRHDHVDTLEPPLDAQRELDDGRRLRCLRGPEHHGESPCASSSLPARQERAHAHDNDTPTDVQHMIADVVRLEQGLIEHRDTPGGPDAWFADISHFTFVFKILIYLVTAVLGDAIVVTTCSAPSDSTSARADGGRCRSIGAIWCGSRGGSRCSPV